MLSSCEIIQKIKRELEKTEILGYSEDEVRQHALKKLRDLIIQREKRIIELHEEIVYESIKYQDKFDAQDDRGRNQFIISLENENDILLKRSLILEKDLNMAKNKNSENTYVLEVASREREKENDYIRFLRSQIEDLKLKINDEVCLNIQHRATFQNQN